ncbi:MAG: N-acetyltransferase [Bacteroidota bacterium]
MKFIKTTILSKTSKVQILELWNNEFPEKLNYPALTDFENYLSNLKDQSHILMLDEHEQIKGWYFDFVRDKERWFAIIMDAEMSGKGFGTQLLNLGKENQTVLNGWVIDHSNEKKRNGETYISPLNFYLKNRFLLLPESRLEFQKLSAVKIQWKKIQMK